MRFKDCTEKARLDGKIALYQFVKLNLKHSNGWLFFT